MASNSGCPDAAVGVELHGCVSALARWTSFTGARPASIEGALSGFFVTRGQMRRGVRWFCLFCKRGFCPKREAERGHLRSPETPPGAPRRERRRPARAPLERRARVVGVDEHPKLRLARVPRLERLGPPVRRRADETRGF